MLRFLTFVVPFLARNNSRIPIKVMMRRSGFILLVMWSCCFFLAALFTWMYKAYNLEIAFLTVGVVLAFAAITVKFYRAAKTPEKPAAAALPPELDKDVLAAYIPESMAGDPIVQKLLKEIAENPVAATATAVTLGMLISREYFD